MRVVCARDGRVVTVVICFLIDGCSKPDGELGPAFDLCPPHPMLATASNDEAANIMPSFMLIHPRKSQPRLILILALLVGIADGAHPFAPQKDELRDPL